VGEGGKPAVSDLSVRHLTIPEEPRGLCSGLKVKGIAKGAFSGCSSLLGLSLPETITTLDDEALEGCDNLLALRWNAEKALPTEALSDVYATNPNFLLYVKDKAYAPTDIKNVVVNGTAETVILSEANSGNSFYCPWPFTAKSIQLTHRYGMTSGYQTCQGWETIALPFDVTAVFSDTGAELVPRNTWTRGDMRLPFWLYEQTADGWQAASAIKANAPYIISMPNNVEHYDQEYNISGDVTFVGSNVMVKASDDLVTGLYGQRRLLPSFQYKEADYGIYALNVSNLWYQHPSGTYLPGSTFIRALRPIHPFEAYMTFESGNAPAYIPLFDDGEVMGIRDALRQMDRKPSNKNNKVYDLQGRHVSKDRLPKGLYVTGGRKVVIQ
ncbi:MAG: leucine-rich repeat domain-containing protein, partial [Prevotella sp.]|nr:leucine-rich repeat domain-containing protein [Prevotella sp.]